MFIQIPVTPETPNDPQNNPHIYTGPDEQSPLGMKKASRSATTRPLHFISFRFIPTSTCVPAGGFVILLHVSRYSVQHRPGFVGGTGGLEIAPPQKFHVIKSTSIAGPA